MIFLNFDFFFTYMFLFFLFEQYFSYFNIFWFFFFKIFFTRWPIEPKRPFWRAPALQTPPKFHEKTPRESIKSEISGGRKKKKLEILPPPSGRSGPRPSGPTLCPSPLFLGLGLHSFGPYPSGPPPFWAPIWPSTFIGFAHSPPFGSLCSCFCCCFWTADCWKTHPCRFWPSKMFVLLLLFFVLLLPLFACWYCFSCFAAVFGAICAAVCATCCCFVRLLLFVLFFLLFLLHFFVSATCIIVSAALLSLFCVLRLLLCVFFLLFVPLLVFLLLLILLFVLLCCCCLVLFVLLFVQLAAACAAFVVCAVFSFVFAAFFCFCCLYYCFCCFAFSVLCAASASLCAFPVVCAIACVPVAAFAAAAFGPPTVEPVAAFDLPKCQEQFYNWLALLSLRKKWITNCYKIYRYPQKPQKHHRNSTRRRPEPPIASPPFWALTFSAFGLPPSGLFSAAFGPPTVEPPPMPLWTFENVNNNFTIDETHFTSEKVKNTFLVSSKKAFCIQKKRLSCPRKTCGVLCHPKRLVSPKKHIPNGKSDVPVKQRGGWPKVF